jgi:transglutaminase-like putative cysteine protease
MRFALRYETEYRYSGPVFDQHNSLRVKPASGPFQRVRNFRLAVDPSARTRTYRDYFGTEVVDFNVPGEHDRLAITADAEVITQAAAEAPAGGWERARGEEYTTAGGEFLLRTSDEPPNGALNQLIEDVRGGDPRSTLEAVCELIPERFEYSPGVTFVGSTVDDLLEAGAGVCQDFVHLSLILLRRHGVAARYVSGCSPARRTAERTRSRSTRTRGSKPCCPPRTAEGRPGWARTPRTASLRARST